MKLFVWHDVLSDYTGGIAFALAETVDQARELILDGYVAKHLGGLNGVTQYYADQFRAELEANAPEVHEGPVGEYLHGGA